MRKSVKKKKSSHVPQTQEEATEMLGQIGTLQKQTKRVSDRADERIRLIRADAVREITPALEQIAELFRGLKAFAEAHRDELTQGGKKKTVTLPTGKLSWRTTPPKLEIKDEDGLLAYLEAAGLSEYYRTKLEVDKDALKKNAEEASSFPGVSVTSAEVFGAKPESGTGELTAAKVQDLLKSVS